MQYFGGVIVPIQALKNEFEIELTHECNWNCPYCAIHVHSLPFITVEELKTKILSVPNGIPVTLSGGEPGLVSSDVISWVINTLKNKNCICFLNTNGLFIKKYPELLHNFKQIIYHCSENLNCDDNIINVEHSDVRYMIIVNDDNYHKLELFLKTHPNITFDIVKATYDGKNTGVGLSCKNRNERIIKFSNRMTKQSFIRMFKEKEFERVTYL